MITSEARTPIFDPTLGISVPRPQGDAPNRLVAIGDSLTHGFQSDAIFNTDWSYPAVIARELGWYDSFRHPEYIGFGGLPLNIEFLVREIEQRFGAAINWWQLGSAVFFVYGILSQIRNYWEHGAGANVPTTAGIMHNLAVSGYDVRDVISRTADFERQSMTTPTDPLLKPMVQNAGELMALYVLNSAVSNNQSLSPVQAAAALGQQGIETLTIFIGANNALRTVVDLALHWSQAPDYSDLAKKSAFNIWNPLHFASEYDELASAVWDVNAQHVIWCTVPHVTIAPIAHGIGSKVAPGSRYFPYYTRPWIADQQFDPTTDQAITANQARAVDSAIDQYNDGIVAVVEYGRNNGRDWLLLDIAGLLDRLAARRYLLDPAARPKWWTPYTLPAPVAALSPRPDSQFFAANMNGRVQGGLFSLDGVHGTTITYAILAQEFINVMLGAGVKFLQADGVSARPGPITIDFAAMIGRDTLISDPPKSLSADLAWAGWINELVDWVKRLGRVL
ncbi:MAG: hypothetical protein JOY61_20070 [Chloroflexi bacterium]|nr:hypothetical protein [Chloroflexota bacterium]